MSLVEQEIIKRFDETADTVVSDSVSDNHFELVPILQFFGHPQVSNRLLDVGSGKGKFIPPLTQRGFNVIGVEPSSILLRSSQAQQPSAQLIQASVTNLPFADATFDFVMCVETLEHIPDTEKAISEMARVLKPNGKMIIIDKNIISLHPIHFAPTAIWKRWLEDTNRWMYSKKFPFREKYFVPHTLNRTIQTHFSRSEIEFLRFWPEAKVRSSIKQALWNVHRRVSIVLHRAIPALNFYVAWKAIK